MKTFNDDKYHMSYNQKIWDLFNQSDKKVAKLYYSTYFLRQNWISEQKYCRLSQAEFGHVFIISSQLLLSAAISWPKKARLLWWKIGNKCG